MGETNIETSTSGGASGCDGGAPAISVVIVAGDQRHFAARALRSLLGQCCGGLEVVLVDCGRNALPPFAEATDPRVRVLRLSPATLVGVAAEAGLRSARAPVVAFLDAHSIALPGWVDALAAAHRGPWAGVGGEVYNASAGEGLSDAIYMMSSAPFLPPASRGEVDRLPPHDSSFKRSVLLGYGEALAPLLGALPVLHRVLVRDGHRLFLEPDAATAHTFVTTPVTLLNHVLWSRSFADVRARALGWSFSRRAAEVALAPIRPAGRAARLALLVVRRRPARLWSVLVNLPAVLLAEIAAVTGEILGIVFGAGRAEVGSSRRELRGAGVRPSYLLPRGSGPRVTMAPLAATPQAQEAPASSGETDGSLASPDAAPLLSVVMVVGNQRARAGHALRSVLQQSLVDRMEVLVVDMASGEAPALRGSDHPAVHVMTMTRDVGFGAVRAEAVRRARGPVVAFLEEHAFAFSGWAEAIVRAHRGPYAGVGAEIYNGNSGIGLSDAAYLIAYTRWLPPAVAGASVLLPGHNSSYRRDVLLGYGDALADLLGAEPVLQWRLQRDGHVLLTEPEVKLAHRQESTLHGLEAYFLWSRALGAIRAASFRWSPWKKLAYAAASPLAPWLRVARVLMHLCRTRPGRLWTALVNAPAMLLIEHAMVLGQATGLALGARGVAPRLLGLEIDDVVPR